MNYNDFQILDNDLYKLINNQYQTKSFNRKELVLQICIELTECNNMCLIIQNNHNYKIKKSVEYLKSSMLKMLDNFSSTFNLLTQNHTLKNVTIFSFLNKLLTITHYLFQWSTSEEKEYYKSIANKSLIELLNQIKELISNLDESFYYFFKHL